MYLLTYVGRWMNGLTLLMLLWVVAFTAPRIYRCARRVKTSN